ncbi:MAG TPA: hypothetical protein VLD67_08345, partial [Vicinamibacterales bacterium]|nr:hypothetical protein [Vicinamibacterales bacterium]
PRGASGQLQVRARLTSEGSTIPLTDAVVVEDVGPIGQPLLFRRGPSTGNRVLPAADFRFSRSERLHLEIPVVQKTTPLEGRVLDRTGQPLPIPVTVGAREDDGTGQPWITADAMLAPLAPADYALEVRMAGTGADQSGEERVLVAFRVVR